MLVCRFLAPGGRLWVVLAIVGMIVAGGCSQGGYSGPTGTVKGKVTLKGEPVPAGTGVTFVSDDGFAASGKVDASGNYELSIGAGGDQIPVASYKVMVSPPGAGGEQSEADYEAMMEASASGEGQSQPAPAKEEVIPAKYKSTASSGLSYEVKAGDNTIDITLE